MLCPSRFASLSLKKGARFDRRKKKGSRRVNPWKKRCFGLRKARTRGNCSFSKTKRVKKQIGVVNTDIFGWDYLPLGMKIAGWLLWPAFWCATKNCEEGAQPILMTLFCNENDDKFKKGGFHSNGRCFEFGYGNSKIKETIEKNSKRLYEVTLTALGLAPARLQ